MHGSPEGTSRIADIAADTLGVERARIGRIERIPGGLTNESWLVTTAMARVVVRISNADEAALQINRGSECRVLAEVEQAGIGPEVLRCHPEARVLVTGYVPGTLWTREDAVERGNVLRLAELLRRLHGLDIRRDVAATHLSTIVERYWAIMADRGLPDPAGPPWRQEIRAIARDLDAGARRCLCHNDVHHLNVIDTGRLWLIDWEYAGIGNPWFDLASVCCNHDYASGKRQLLLQHYLGYDDREALLWLQAACRLFDYIRQVWLLVRG